MSGSYNKINLHIVFSTKNRYPFFKNALLRKDVFSYIAALVKKQNSLPIIIGGWVDHIHILCQYSPQKPLPELIRYIKRNSSRWLKQKGMMLEKFYWQTGYAAFSVSESMIPIVKKYIADQEDHHKKTTFREEYIAFLKKHQIDYDPKYVFIEKDNFPSQNTPKE